ncbi:MULTISPECIES: STAS domain-containing protein [unclassified Pseudoxanthomonas]|uniref:STAS domain-containing protein n=1 Tax=unclassified Pseudoxanthomonas TaxID=2645906 RepID=UPI00161B7327|nr:MULTISPECIES: STAS domain-containing protein [unclassified Pseudoxanthomonas]MBB3276578.1 anti-anti-sigma factor [Pseudoxanthomonas sp. OG2]MBV7472347.1 STAS domain-containing protein [Pseudoxanthomonas sp. PXM05]
MSLEITLLPPGQGSQRVVVAGRLDTHTYEDLDEALAPLMMAQLHSLVLDLSQLEYISSAGIRSIFKARKTLAAHGGKVLVVNPQPQIQKVFDVVKAVPLNDIFGSTAEADAYLDAMQRKVLQGDDSD